MFKDVQAAIFDLDGTLIDSMWIWDEINITYLESKGAKRPSDLEEKINHLSFKQTAQYFKDNFNLKESTDEIVKEINDLAYDNYLNKARLKPGAKKLLSYLKSNGIKLALATSNSSPLLDIALESNDIKDFFDNITTTNEVARGKNFPDVYLLAAKRLGVTPDKCIVFEDIPAAVEGAKAAGMKVIAVYDEHSSKHREKLINSADKYIEDFTELAV